MRLVRVGSSHKVSCVENFNQHGSGASALILAGMLRSLVSGLGERGDKSLVFWVGRTR